MGENISSIFFIILCIFYTTVLNWYTGVPAFFFLPSLVVLGRLTYRNDKVMQLPSYEFLLVFVYSEDFTSNLAFMLLAVLQNEKITF